MVPRHYQATIIEQIRAAYRAGYKSVLLVLPTGGGKTFIFCYIAKHAREKGNRVHIHVHRSELLDQASRDCKKLGIPHGLIAAGKHSNPELVQIVSVMTLVRRLGRVASPDLNIFDEGHHVGASTWNKIIFKFPGVPTLGVTASPVRSDNVGLGDFYDFMVIGPSPRELIDDGYMVKPIVFCPPTGFDPSKLKKNGKEYDQAELAEATDRKYITGHTVEHYKSICPGAPAIVFCVNIKHAENVAAEFRAAGFNFWAIDGNTEKNQPGRRKQLISGLENGTVDGLTSCELISEGTDIPRATVCIMLRLTKSLAKFIQMTGRTSRPVFAPGYPTDTAEQRKTAIRESEKPNSIILDHVGNCLNPEFGLPDKDRVWTLERTEEKGPGKKKKEEAVPLKQCPKCFRVHDPAPKCPYCSHEYQIVMPTVGAGELTMVSDEEEEAEFEHRMEKVELGRRIKEAASFPDFQSIAKDAGYKHGWAWYQWKLRKGKMA